MKTLGRLFRQFSSVARSLKNGKSELNFKEGNCISNPYDIIDRNLPGINKRLRLYEMRRLKEQLKLDLPELDNLKNKYHEYSKNVQNSGLSFEIRYSSITDFPGMNFPTESSTDSNVTISADFKSLELTKSAIDNLIKFFNMDQNSQSLEFTVSDFPFISQNKKRAIEILQELIRLSKSNDFEGLKNISFVTQNPKLIKETGKKIKSKLNLEFPNEWLKEIKQTEQ